MKRYTLCLSITLTLATGIHAGNNKVPRVQVKEWGPEFEGIKNLYGQAVADRSNLAQLREKHIALFEQEEKKPQPNYLSLTRGITSDTIDYINNMVAETIAKLGPPPVPFSLFTMGSMARDESGFFTDLEVGILVQQKTPAVQKYFAQFAQILADRLYLLGEHPAVQGKGLRIDEADNAPAHMKWFARYASPTQMQNLDEIANDLEKRKELTPKEGSRIFLATPKEFAGYLDANIEEHLKGDFENFRNVLYKEEQAAWKREQKKPAAQRRTLEEIKLEVRNAYSALLKPLYGYELKVLKSLLGLTRNLRHLYGDKALFDRFVTESKKYLDGPASESHAVYTTRRQEIAFKELLNDMQKFITDPSAPVQGKLDDDLDIKRRLYRWPEQVLTNLSYWYALGTQNGEEILQELVSRGLFDPKLAQQTRALLNYATGLRLKEQAVLRKQGKTVPMSMEEWQDQKEKMTQELEYLKAGEAFALKMLPPLKTVTRDAKGNIDKIQATQAAEILMKRDLIHAKVLEKQVELASFDKLKPNETFSIIKPKDVEQLQTIYLPILNELFLRAQAFATGDTKAFSSSREEFFANHPYLKPITPPNQANAAPTSKPTLLPQPNRTTQPATPALLPRPKPTTQSPAINTTTPDDEARIAALRAVARKALSLNPVERKQALEARAELHEIEKRKALKG
jgi:hypothetical protein